jgi:AcrR family transcriptional regulator
MPPGRKPAHSREEFVAAAIAYADEHGLPALTLAAVGRAVGVSTTAVYRYFRDKDALIVAMREELLGQALAGGAAAENPHERIIAAALAFRRTARRHPCLGDLMVTAVLEGDNAATVPRFIGAALEELGLSGRPLVRGYRQLESFVVGTCVFDFSGVPSHVQDRFIRMRLIGHPEVDAVLAAPSDVDAINEEAFEASLTCLLDGLIAQAAGDVSG